MTHTPKHYLDTQSFHPHSMLCVVRLPATASQSTPLVHQARFVKFAVLAAAEQLMASLGKAVDAKELTEARLQLSEAMDMVGVARELRAGVDFTAEGLQAVIERELQLHRQIYTAIWSAVSAMERWSTGVNRWLARVTKDTNSWLATNAHIAAQHPSPAARPYMGYVPIPMPGAVDLRQSRATLELLPAPPPAADQLQPQQQSDEAQQVASASAVQAGSGGIRLGADLGSAAVDSDAQLSSPAVAKPQLLNIANQWVSSTGAGTPGPRWGDNTRMTSSGVTLDLQRLQEGDMRVPSIGWQRLTSHAGRDVPQSPGGVSLHNRFAGQPTTPAGQSGFMSTLRGFLSGQPADASSSEPSSSTEVTAVTTTRSPRPSEGSPSPRPSSASRPRSSSRPSVNRVVPLATAGGEGSPGRLSPGPSAGAGSNRRSATIEDLGFSTAVSSSVAGTRGGEVMPGSVGGDGGSTARRVSQADRLPTVTGRTPRNKLQPIE